MCVIAVAIKSAVPLNILRACQSANPHGGGCSWVESGLVHFRKNLNANQIHDLLKDKPLPHVVHFRIATAGGVQPSRCHPFIIKTTNNDALHGKAKSVLFHNGHCSGWEFYASMAGVGYPRDASDSQVIARIVAHRGEACLKGFVERNAGKFAVMRSSGEVQLFGGFTERDGLLFSNTNWANGLSCNPLEKQSQGLHDFKKNISHGAYRYKPWWHDDAEIENND